MRTLTLRHLGASGLLVELDGRALAIDPPAPVDAPTVITWSEAERVAGAATSAPLAAAPEVLAWLGRDGTPLTDGVPAHLGDFDLLPSGWPPIPYAVPAEAVRKTLSALRSPVQAARRLAHTLRRPEGQPLAVQAAVGGVRIALLQQSLHRFTPDDVLGRLVARYGGADVLVAGTDFEDEAATGRLMGCFGCEHVVLADFIGPIRRSLHLPVRPLAVTLAHAPAGTLVLEEGRKLEIGVR